MQKKKEKDELKTFLDYSTKTVKLMDRFEGYDEECTRYKRIVVSNYTSSRTLNGYLYSCNLVIERSKGKHVGNITLTQLKNRTFPQYRQLLEYLSSQIDENIIAKYGGKNEIFYFDPPFLLRAQNQLNRTGYGWEWDWSGGVGNVISEGTEYGETTNYVIAGAYIDAPLKSIYGDPVKKIDKIK